MARKKRISLSFLAQNINSRAFVSCTHCTFNDGNQ